MEESLPPNKKREGDGNNEGDFDAIIIGCDPAGLDLAHAPVCNAWRKSRMRNLI